MVAVLFGKILVPRRLGSADLYIFISKETTGFAKKKVNITVKKEIEELQPSTININNRIMQVKHILNFTMINGKLVNAVTSTTCSQSCYVCGAHPTEMFKCLLCVSYWLEVKKWQVSGENDKDLYKFKMAKVQKDFKERTGLLVDVPKAGGSGATNDGNTAWFFFKNPHLLAEITRVDKVLIKRLSIVLQTIKDVSQ